MSRPYQPIILIGPARSGTKIMRDTIATHPSIAKVGFDINFIWKRFNEGMSHDALEAEQATDKVQRYIRKYFAKQAEGKPFVIEKTVSNTLRIPFVLRAFPDAKFIFLYRDGRDAVESVVRQWGVAPDNSYLVKKFLSVPFFDVLPYVIKYAIDLLRIKL
ncbi:MAG: sulfotransferase, partial [Bacteroidota bacterium]